MTTDKRPDDPPTVDAFPEELPAIMSRRAVVGNRADITGVRTSLAGLALSGGGIRSATFALGALQALAKQNALAAFDYVSTVSGGGFAGGWWSAWLSRSDRVADERLFPLDEALELDRTRTRLTGEMPQNHDTMKSAGTTKPMDPKAQPEGSLSVQQGDPIHHLRLFANYLTPRTGLLSGDTWRAITVISRNVILTWAVLLPVLMVLMLCAQLFFAGRDDVGYSFACSRPYPNSPNPVTVPDTDSIVRPLCSVIDTAYASKKFTGADQVVSDVRDTWTATTHRAILVRRLGTLSAPLIASAIVLGACVVFWLIFGSQSVVITGLSVAMLVLITMVIANVPWSHHPGTDPNTGFTATRWLKVSAGVVAVFTVLSLRPWWSIHRGSEAHRKEMQGKSVARDAVRNTIVRWQARALLAFIILFVGLLLAGFGHELVWYLFESETGKVARAGGWIAVLSAGWSTAFTLYKAFPSPRAHDAFVQAPSLVARIAMTIAPFLALLVLGVACAWLGHAIIGGLSEWTAAKGYVYANGATRATVISVLVLTGFALKEAVDRPGERRVAGDAWLPIIATALALGLYALWLVLPFANTDFTRKLSYATATLGIVALVWQWTRETETSLGRFQVASGAVLAVAAMVVALKDFRLDAKSEQPDMLYWLPFGLLSFLTLGMLFGWVRYRSLNRRAVVLASLALVESAALVVLQHLPHTDSSIALRAVIIGWVSFLIAWVVALGWTIDPNLMSLHNFYKSRIVRAYLGASNEQRRDREISEAAPDDDVRLTSLKGHTLGAPLHLVNATLNLVGGHELATAQRSAALFTMSSVLCGSARTGYRPTTQYMDGTLTLGSAVAASGAAVSPTMGAKSVSAPLALLLALFNVRLGFWAPTPNRDRWQERQPTLWPFYLLSEAFSQTNDVGTYCYLTDGGHFDNTGAYALIERGCQYIYVLDDGADPKPCYSDMGDLIRRCRIDFGAEIDLVKGLDAFRVDEKSRLATDHCVRGTIRYDDRHLTRLGWSEGERKTRRIGQILWIKPTVTARNSVDVRQYRLENGEFPQQTTLDQWYDEAQFESYRALGMQSMSEWLEELRGPIDPRNPVSLFEVKERSTPVMANAGWPPGC